MKTTKRLMMVSAGLTMLAMSPAWGHLSEVGDLSDIGPQDELAEVIALLEQVHSPDQFDDLDYLDKWEDDEGKFENSGSLDLSAYVTVTDWGISYGLSWDLTGSGYQLWAVGVKAANGANNFRVYETTVDQRWVGTGETVWSANNKDISHATFFGKRADVPSPSPVPVPDGGMTLMLLGVSLWGVERVRRRRG